MRKPRGNELQRYMAFPYENSCRFENVDEITHISAHYRGTLERNHLKPFATLIDRLFGHITQSNKIVGYFNTEVEGGLEIRLIEARKSSPGITRLELGAEHQTVVSFCRNGFRWFDCRLVL